MDDIVLSRYDLSEDIILSESSYTTLSVNHPPLLYEYIQDILGQIDGNDEGNFRLCFDGKELKFSTSVSMISNINKIEFNSRIINAFIIKELTDYISFNNVDDFLLIEKTISSLIEGFIVDSGLDLDYDDCIKSQNIAKMLSLKINEEHNSLVEKVLSYLSLVVKLSTIKVFIILFAKEFLTSDDITSIYNFCIDNNVRLLLIEGNDQYLLGDQEKRIIIDEDLCIVSQSNV